jgi:RHS repeat-associated protein
MSGATLQKSFIALPGGSTAVYTASGLDHYRHPDWLGSSRSSRFTSSTTRTATGFASYAPFGETVASSTGPDLSFTGQNQDTASGLYDFLYREFDPLPGRWPTPDPAGLAAISLDNPQSLNRYDYVLDAPTEWVDLLGFGPKSPKHTGPACINVYADKQCSQPSNHCLADPWDCMYGGMQFQIITSPTGYYCGFGGDCGPCCGRGWFPINGNISLAGLFGNDGPTIGPAPPRSTSHCRIVDPVEAALDLTFKIGPEGEAGPIKLGGSIYMNHSTGESGGEGEINLGLLSAQVDNPTPPGGSLGGTTEGPEYKISILGFEKNLTRGTPFTFAPSHNLLRLGLQLGVGFELRFNSEEFNAQVRANDACRAQGGS